MLDSGLARKAAQAKLAVTLNKENAAQVRDAMTSTVGNQGFKTRIDSSGIRRAAAISATQRRARSAMEKGQTSLAERLRAEVEQQKRVHAWLNEWRLNKELHAYISKIRRMHLQPFVYNCDETSRLCEADT